MMGYIRSLTRSLRVNDYNANLIEDALFTDKKDGLNPVLHNQSV